MKNKVTIQDRIIGPDQPPYIVAEISGNHCGEIIRAKKLIKLAKDSGACAVKLQTFTADSLTLNSDSDKFILKEGTWAGRRLYDLYTETHTPWSWFRELFSYADTIGITIFSSPFDLKAVKLLEELDAPAYKIASNELVDWPLVEAVVKTGKPVIVSTGTASKQDVADTLEFIKEIGGNKVIVLHCVSAYPAHARDSHLETMIDLRDSFDVPVGLSDHTLGTVTSVAAVALGACIIEKHYTLDRTDGGPDSSFSLEPEELKLLCRDTLCAWESVQGIKYGNETNLEKKGIFTRQFWSIMDINVGTIISKENVKSVRAPANEDGISPKHFRDLFGKRAKNHIQKHSPIRFIDIQN